MDVKKYVITCLKCKGQSRINIIDNQTVMYVDHIPIIACRLRGDLQWGFECQCGNDSRLARQEVGQIDMLVQGGAHAIEKLTKSLKVKDKLKFKMEAS